SQTAEIRDALRPSGATFHIAKNTLTRKAAEQAERPHLVEFLQGPTAIAFIADDPAAAAKKLSEVARQTRILAVKGGVLDGHTLTAAQIRELGELPTRDVLRSQVAGRIVGPLHSSVRVLSAPLRDGVAVVGSYIARGQAGEAAWKRRA